MLPTSTSGAHEALRMLREARDIGHPYRLVLTDGHMPDVDGFTLSEWIKSDVTLTNSVVMMLTSGDQHGNIARCERLGIAAYLLKPTKQSELFDAIALAMHGTMETTRVPVEPATFRKPARPLRILLAEDSLVNQKLAIGLLERQGHTVRVANNGQEAVAVAARERFDVVLMDVQMPEMDGMEATAMIRAHERKSGGHLPIIAMTAHAMKGDKEACLTGGMDGYISKPIRATRLFETIEDVLRELQPRRELTQTVDWGKAIETVQGDVTLLRDLVATFLDECPRMLDGIQVAIRGSRQSEVQRIAHQLKGSMRYFGAKTAFDRADELETLGREGQLGNADHALLTLQFELDRIKPDLQEFATTGEL